MRNGPPHPSWPAGSYSRIKLPQPISVSASGAADGSCRVAPMAAAYGASLRGGGWLSKTISGRASRCWSIPAWRSLTAERNVAVASISARSKGPAAGLMIRACETGAGLSCHAPAWQELHCLRQLGRARGDVDQQGGAARGADPFGALAVGRVRANSGDRVMRLEEPLPAAVGAVPGHLGHVHLLAARLSMMLARHPAGATDLLRRVMMAFSAGNAAAGPGRGL